MIIYGTALLAACHLLGAYIGDLLGIAIGVKANVGGVGIAMILLISVRHWMRQHGLMTQMTEDGVAFWSLMYIPSWWPWPLSKTSWRRCVAALWRSSPPWARCCCAQARLP